MGLMGSVGGGPGFCRLKNGPYKKTAAVTRALGACVCHWRTAACGGAPCSMVGPSEPAGHTPPLSRTATALPKRMGRGRRRASSSTPQAAQQLSTPLAASPIRRLQCSTRGGGWAAPGHSMAVRPDLPARVWPGGPPPPGPPKAAWPLAVPRLLGPQAPAPRHRPQTLTCPCGSAWPPPSSRSGTHA